MINWRQILSWKEPETLVGWLVKMTDSLNVIPYYQVITQVTDKGKLVGPLGSINPEFAITNYKNYLKGIVPSTTSRDPNEVILIKKIF